MQSITAKEFYKLVSKTDIENAIKYVADNSIDLKPSTIYSFISDNGNSYPPKDILRYAANLKEFEIIENSFFGGDSNIPFERLGYRIIKKDVVINTGLLSKYWTQYKDYFKLPELEHKEKYKWAVLKQVYDKWNWDIEDKALMFKKAFDVEGLKNLWMSGNFYPIPHTIWMFERHREETISAFNFLFNEEVDLKIRIQKFLELYDKKLPELQKILPDKKIEYHSHNDLRAISLYLTLQYPEKYYLYKYGMVRAFCGKLQLPDIKKGEKDNLSTYFNIANQILDFIKDDSEFLNVYKNFTNQEAKYTDESLHLLVQDFIYTIANHFNDNKKYWRIGTSDGDGNSFIDYMLDGEYVAIGWNNIGDLDSYNLKNKQDLIKIIDNKSIWFSTNNVKYRKSGEIFDFYSTANNGDVVLLMNGNSVSAIGEIEENYDYDSTLPFAHFRKVKWLKKDIKNFYLADGTQTTFYQLTKSETLRKINEIISDKSNNAYTEKTDSMNFQYPLNQILYGSPGTGKTYNTKELAVNIILGKKDRNREEILKLYNELQEKRQIYFTTFHQSMSYEDFIEGIKPDNSDGEITYEVKDGIFKQICNEAKYQPGITFEEAYKKILVDINNNDGYIQLKTKTNKVFHVGINKNGNLKLYTNEKLDKPQGVLTKDNLVKQINGEHVFEGWESYFNGVLDELKKNGFSSTTIDEAKKYVLIIDEINRGNISSIFGELITLIEEDKRKGNKEEIEVVLPYSNDKFSVPNNIYIIGTMNTADRSVEALDTALRRRFSFAEMKSKPELLQSHFILYNQLWKYNSSDWHDENWVSAEKNYKELFGLSNEWDIDDGKFWNTFTREGYNLYKHSELLRPYILNYFDLAKMLETINKRIELLIDKDHQIGHSYFINIESVNDLKEIFMNKVIPLLEEYFFGDFGKIGLVLGNEFIQKIDDKYKIQFANFDHEDNQTLREKPIYNFTSFEDWTLESFKSIYS